MPSCSFRTGGPVASSRDRFALVAMCTLFLATCATPHSPQPEVLRVGGSDTMLLLTRQWASRFMERHEAVVVQVSGGGSGAGIESLISGSIDICATSRPLTAEEVERLFRKQGSIGVTYRVAKDALSIFVNPENRVRDLSLLQLKGIFTGRIAWWGKVGGPERPIRVVTRQPSSGTFRFFQQFVLDGEPYAESAVPLPTTDAIVKEVESDPSTIGYGGVAYGPNVVHCGVGGVSPTAANIRSGNYPLSRYLLLATARLPEGWAKSFVDWVLEPEGQGVVLDVGYVPILDPSDGADQRLPLAPGSPSH